MTAMASAAGALATAGPADYGRPRVDGRVAAGPVSRDAGAGEAAMRAFQGILVATGLVVCGGDGEGDRRAFQASLAATGLVVGGLGGTAGSAAARVTARLSGPSPYAACSTPAVDDVRYPNAEVELDVASSPLRPRNLVAVWQQ